MAFRIKVKESASRVFGSSDSVFVAVLSHIESSLRNEANFLQNINNCPICAEDLVPVVLFTRQRCGALGK